MWRCLAYIHSNRGDVGVCDAKSTYIYKDLSAEIYGRQDFYNL